MSNGRQLHRLPFSLCIRVMLQGFIVNSFKSVQLPHLLFKSQNVVSFRAS